MADKLPGKGFFGWFGRQVGYVTKAVKAQPTAAPRIAAKPSAAQSGNPRTNGSAHPQPDPAEAAGNVLYRQGHVHEAEHPTRPGVKLRRTIIDEVIVDGDDGAGQA